jgi:hypothetical protein
VDKRRSLLAIPSTDGLGAVLEPPPLRSRPSQTGETLQPDTFAFDCIVLPPGLQATTEATPGADCGKRGERRCISQVAVCLNPSEFGTSLVIRTWRCALAPASGPPKDGQPPPDSHSGCRACQRLSDQQKWRFRTAQRSERETQTWPMSQWCELPLHLLVGATNCSWRTCTARSRVRHLTFDMRGPQKAQPFVGPLDGRVRHRARLPCLLCSHERRGASHW